MITTNADYDNSMYLYIGCTVGAFIFLVLMLSMANCNAKRRTTDRSTAINSVVATWNERCFRPAGYNITTGDFGVYFLLINNNPPAQNPANFAGPVMGGFPGIPNNYVAGQQPFGQQPQMFIGQPAQHAQPPIGAQQPMLMGQPSQPIQNAQPYVQAPLPYAPHAKEGGNFNYPNNDDGSSVNIHDVNLNRK